MKRYRRERYHDYKPTPAGEYIRGTRAAAATYADWEHGTMFPPDEMQRQMLAAGLFANMPASTPEMAAFCQGYHDYLKLSLGMSRAIVRDHTVQGIGEHASA